MAFKDHRDLLSSVHFDSLHILYVCRCPDKCKFIRNPMNIIDFLAVLP